MAERKEGLSVIQVALAVFLGNAMFAALAGVAFCVASDTGAQDRDREVQRILDEEGPAGLRNLD